MQINHHVALHATPAQIHELQSLQIVIRKMDAMGTTFPSSYVYFDVVESHPKWPIIATLLAKWKLRGIVSTKFAARELQSARFLKLSAWHWGYPQPEDNFCYIHTTYDTTQYCEQCGAGGKQMEPFRMKAEPKWGKRNILQLNWVYDEHFTQPEVWEKVFRPLRIGCLPVLKDKTEVPLKSVVQIETTQAAVHDLSLTDTHQSEVCMLCNRKKYIPLTKGMFPSFRGPETAHMFRTKETFGSGGSAWNAIIVSHDLFESFFHNKVSGASFTPIE